MFRIVKLAARVVPVVAFLAVATVGRGQSIGVDPYDPWNAMYRSFIYPTAPPNPALPNQGRLDAIGGATTYGDFLDSVGVAGAADPFGRTGRPGGRFTPYYMNYRQLADPDRMYQPNAGDTFYEDQQRRQKAMADAQLIRDPKRRAAEIKRLRREAEQAARRGSAVRGGLPPAPRPADTKPTDAKPAEEGAAEPEHTGLLDDNPVARDLLLPEIRDTSKPSRTMRRRRPATPSAAGSAPSRSPSTTRPNR